MSNTVTITISSEDTQALNSFRSITREAGKAEKQMDKLAAAMFRAGRAEGPLKAVGMTMGRMAASVFGATAAFHAMKAGITAVLMEQHKLNVSVAEAGKRQAQEQLKLQIQAGFTPLAVKKQMPQLERQLLKTPSTNVSGLIDIQTQLASSDFQKGDVESGEAAGAFLELKAVVNEFGEVLEDPKAALRSMSMFMKANGVKQPGAADMRLLGKDVTQIFEVSDFQFPDLAELAGEASTLSAKGITPKEQLATFSALVDQKFGSEAATGLRQVAERLSTAANFPEKTAALEKLGLKPEEVDLTGETIVQALDRLGEKVRQQPQEQQNLLLGQIFGEKGQAAGAALIQPETLQVINERLESLKNPQAYDRNLGFFQGSQFAEDERIKVRTELAERKLSDEVGGNTFERASKAADMTLREKSIGADNVTRGFLAAGNLLTKGFLFTASMLNQKPQDVGIPAGKEAGRMGTGTGEEVSAQMRANEAERQIHTIGEALRIGNAKRPGVPAKGPGDVADTQRYIQEGHAYAGQLPDGPERDRVRERFRKAEAKLLELQRQNPELQNPELQRQKLQTPAGGLRAPGPTGPGPTGSGPTGSGPTGSGPTGSGMGDLGIHQARQALDALKADPSGRGAVVTDRKLRALDQVVEQSPAGERPRLDFESDKLRAEFTEIVRTNKELVAALQANTKATADNSKPPANTANAKPPQKIEVKVKTGVTRAVPQSAALSRRT